MWFASAMRSLPDLPAYGRRTRGGLVHYVAAVASVVLATALRFALSSLIGAESAPFMTYWVAVGASTWLGGIGPGALSIALSSVAASYFFLPPLHNLAMLEPERRGALLVFVCLSAIVAAFIESLRRARDRAALGEEQYATTLSSIADGVIATDVEGRVTFLNPVAEALTGWKNADAKGRSVGDVFRIVNEQTRTEVEIPIARCLADGVITGLANHTLLQAKDGTERPIDDSAAPIRDAGGRVCGAVLVFRDVSDRRRAEAGIEELNARLSRTVAESHHRIKNNLQLLSAMIEIQMPDDGGVVTADDMKRLQQIVRSLAVLHDLLTLDAVVGGDLDSVSGGATVRRLVAAWKETSGVSDVVLSVDDVRLTLKQASAIALLLNELLSNAVKHGRGAVGVTFARDISHGRSGAAQALLEVWDSGAGFPPGFDAKRSAHTGWELIESTVRRDLTGDIACLNRAQGGARVVVSFPLFVPEVSGSSGGSSAGEMGSAVVGAGSLGVGV